MEIERTFIYICAMIKSNPITETSSKANKIKEAVLASVGETGVAGLTMKKIAILAGISPGTLYLYYASKEQMVNSLFLELKQKIAEVAMQGLDAETTTINAFEENFKQVFFNVFQYLTTNPAEQVFLQQGYRSPFVSEESKKQSEAFFAPVISMIETAQAKNEITTALPSYMVLACVNGVMQEAAQACVTIPDTEKHLVGNAAYQFCWQALKKK